MPIHIDKNYTSVLGVGGNDNIPFLDISYYIQECVKNIQESNYIILNYCF